MNTKKKAVYTMIGGLLIKNVPHYAKKIKILSNGSIIAVDKSGSESFIYSPSPSINHDYVKNMAAFLRMAKITLLANKNYHMMPFRILSVIS